jgi:hypothetical protein
MSTAESIAAPPDPTVKAVEPVGTDAAFALRWAAWQARGVAHDRAVRRRLLLALPALTAGAAIAYVLLA